MIKFRNYPHIKPVPETDLYELTKNLNVVYETDDGETKAVLVPKGYQTDGASIPRFLWEEIGHPFSPKFITAAIVHDWHCNIHDGVVKLNSQIVSVDEMSDLFFDLLRLDGVGVFKSFSMEQVVRAYKTFF